MMHDFPRSYSVDSEHYNLDYPLFHRALWTSQYGEPVALRVRIIIRLAP